jgi:DNA-binding XRE family transcriptional regulator
MIHNRIAVLRAERGLSRKELADAVGVNYQTIGYLERGEYSPSIELALKLAAHFKLPVEMIFSQKPFPAMSQQLLKKQHNQ